MALFICPSASAEPVEAHQWFPGHTVQGVVHESPGYPGGAGLLPLPPHAFLAAGKERLTVFAGDWVITEPDGRQHLCCADLFRHNYAPAEHPAAVG